MPSYATENEVRLRYGFHTEQVAEEGDGKVNVGDTSIRLSKRAYSILSIELNGVALVAGTAPLAPGEYEFIRPKTLSLGTAIAADDFFDITFGTELPTTTIDQFLDQATQIVKSYLRDRYGDALLTEWETLTPPFIERLTAMIAGNDAERSMLRKGHKFDPNAMELLNREFNRLMKMLDDIAKGKLEIPDEDILAGQTKVFRGLDQVSVFAKLQDVRDVDIHWVDHELGTDGRGLDPGIGHIVHSRHDRHGGHSNG